MDPFDEFEFTPLTEGLGFHKKAEKIKHDIKSSALAQEKTARTVPEPPRPLLNQASAERPASQSISELIASLPPSLDFMEEKEAPAARQSTRASSVFDTTDSFGRPQIFHPLGREENSSPTIGSLISPSMNKTSMAAPAAVAPAPLTPPAPTVVAKAPTASSPYRERLDESFARAFPHAEKSKRESISDNIDSESHLSLEPTSAHLGAGLLDGMVVAGISTIALVCILAITRINLIGMLTNAKTDLPTQIHLGLLFVAVLQMYMLVARAFFGASLGEWAFDLRLGHVAQAKRWTYPLQIVWRTLLITGTGLVVLPLLSLVSRRDLLKYLTGLQLFKVG